MQKAACCLNCLGSPSFLKPLELGKVDMKHFKCSWNCGSFKIIGLNCSIKEIERLNIFTFPLHKNGSEYWPAARGLDCFLLLAVCDPLITVLIDSGVLKCMRLECIKWWMNSDLQYLDSESVSYEESFPGFGSNIQ